MACHADRVGAKGSIQAKYSLRRDLLQACLDLGKLGPDAWPAVEELAKVPRWSHQRRRVLLYSKPQPITQHPDDSFSMSPYPREKYGDGDGDYIAYAVVEATIRLICDEHVPPEELYKQIVDAFDVRDYRTKYKRKATSIEARMGMPAARKEQTNPASVDDPAFPGIASADPDFLAWRSSGLTMVQWDSCKLLDVLEDYIKKRDDS
jgi:hypothetical protein